MIRISHLDKTFNRGKQNEIRVLKDVSLELPDRGMVAVFGRSGCGKTTLLNLLGGLDSAKSGEVSVDGTKMTGSSDELRNRSVGYIFQNYLLNKNETCFQNVADALLLCGMTDKEGIARRVESVLAAVGMEHFAKRTPDTLSGGQQQRIAIARAIVKNPSVILADEPTGNLDEANTLHVMRLLKAISRDRLVVLVTHEEKLVDVFCDRVITLSDGAVVSDEENASTEHYAVRDKNTVYLGELEKTSLSSSESGVSFDLFGEKPETPVSIRLISTGGKIYLKVDSPEVRILDSTSEIKLEDGRFEGGAPVPVSEDANADTNVTKEEKAEENEDDTPRALPSLALSPEECTKPAGRLFSFRSAWVSGLKVNFSIKKKGRKLLRNCLIFFAAVLVFMTASLGVFIRNLSDAGNQYHKNALYVYAGDAESAAALSDIASMPGVRYSTITDGYSIHYGAMSESAFRIGSFETFSGSSYYIFSDPTRISAMATKLLFSYGAGKRLVAGEAVDDGANILISTGFADALLESSTVGYIKDYDDLIGIYDEAGKYRIGGIVSEKENEIYLPASEFTWALRADMNSEVFLPSQFGLNDEAAPAPGTVFIYYAQKPELVGKTFSVGDEVKIGGLPFTVAKIIPGYSLSYESWVEEEGYSLPERESYFADKVKADYPGLEPTDPGYGDALLDCTDRYLADYYGAYLAHYDAFLHEAAVYSPTYQQNDHVLLYLYDGVREAYYFNEGATGELKNALVYLFYVDQFMQSNPGAPVLPETELRQWVSDMGDPEMISIYKEWGDSLLYSDYYRDGSYVRSYIKSQSYLYSYSGYIMNEADLEPALSHPGETTVLFSFDDYYDWQNSTHYYPGDNAIGYSDYLLLICDDPEAVAKEVEARLGDHYDAVIDAKSSFLDEDWNHPIYTPGDFREEVLSTMKADILADAIELAVFLAIMSVCMYFIMRSALMGRIREIGICRAIGVSKKNLLFRFFTESLAVTTVTVLIGYLFSVVLLSTWLTKVPLFSDMFFFPPWMAGATLLLLYAISVLCGVLPVIRLLRKTPAEILSKYDI